MKILKWLLGIFVLIIILFALTILIGTIGVLKDGKTDKLKDQSVLTKAEYGAEYPYTIDKLAIHCENQAIWLEDNSLNKYALNGIAYNKFNGRGDFKGYTTKISIKNAQTKETDIIEKALKLCN